LDFQHGNGFAESARSGKDRAPRARFVSHRYLCSSHIDIEKFRHREWAPALRAAGIAHRRLYDYRHTFVTWAIESGIELWYLARVMGTSTAQIEDTYARWLKRTDDQLRAAFDAYDNAATAHAVVGR
jgi:integrase